MPERTSAPSTASPITRQVMGRISLNRPWPATWAKAVAAGVVEGVDEQPEQERRRRRAGAGEAALAGKQARTV